jgi:hypothetical protein
LRLNTHINNPRLPQAAGDSFNHTKRQKLPMNIRSTFPLTVSLSKILLTAIILASFGLVPVAQAQITLSFVYDPGTNTTTASYSGSWATFSQTGSGTYGSFGLIVDNRDFVNVDGDVITDQGTAALAGTVPWIQNYSPTGHSGDAFGFQVGSSNYDAPASYIAGTNLSGQLVFADTTLADLGFDASEIANGGSFVGGGNTVNWTASVAAVPEPATYAVFFGAGALVCAAYRNRRRLRLGSC